MLLRHSSLHQFAPGGPRISVDQARTMRKTPDAQQADAAFGLPGLTSTPSGVMGTLLLMALVDEHPFFGM